MSNKTSDENVGSIEEDIKIIKNSWLYNDEENVKFVNAIEHMLAELEQKDKKIQKLEEEKPMWEQEMIADKMKLEEALNIVDAMYQDRYKKIEENNTVYVDRLKDVKFTNLEFASVILLREVQSLQRKLENSIPKQVVIEALEDIKDYFDRLNGPDEDMDYIRQVKQELLEGGNENG